MTFALAIHKLSAATSCVHTGQSEQERAGAAKLCVSINPADRQETEVPAGHLTHL